MGMQRDAVHINQMPQEAIMAALKANNEAVMKAWYISNYKKTEAFVLQNSGSSSEAKDVYQEAFIAVWQNVRNEAFIPESKTSLHGYLYQIAKHKWIDYLRSAHHRKTVSESQLHLVDFEAGEEANDTENEKIAIITKAFKRLDDSCRHVLEQFYFERKKYKALAEELGMEEASVRNQKYRCMQKLRELIQKSNNQ